MIPTLFNDDWYIIEERGIGTYSSLTGPILLPHDAMINEKRDPLCLNSNHSGYYPGGKYRYTKTFKAEEEWREGQKSVVVQFDGVYHRSEVWINGVKVGGRPSGYITFHVDLTPHLKYGEGAENKLEVVVDNSQEPNSRWYSGSGIYRDVYLLIGGKTRIKPFGGRVRTSVIDEEENLARLELDVEVEGKADEEVVVKARVIAPEGGKTLFTASTSCKTGTDAQGKTRLYLEVNNPCLWSPETPTLYNLQIDLLPSDSHSPSPTSSTPIDTLTQTFGIRTVEVDASRGFRINSTPYKLRGSCIHADHGPVGAVCLQVAEERRVKILKEAGYNAIRMAHHSAAPALLRACDKLGMLVMDELTDMWWYTKSDWDYGLDFMDWWERDVDALCHKAYNHPSVVMYSIGNEIFEGGTPEGAEMAGKLARRFKKVDPTRPTTSATNPAISALAVPWSVAKPKPRPEPTADGIYKKKEDQELTAGPPSGGGVTVALMNHLMNYLRYVMPVIARLPATDRHTRDHFAQVDIAGWNYMTARYELDLYDHPERVILGSETFPDALFDNWQLVEKYAAIIGDFVWTGWDYIGEAAIATPRYGSKARNMHGSWPAQLAGEPIIDITGYRLPLSYWNQIIWKQEVGPFLAVHPVDKVGETLRASIWRETDAVRSWSWPGHEGKWATVDVFSGAEVVELKLDGKSLGRKKCGLGKKYKATFSVKYRAGTLSVVGYDKNGDVVGSDEIKSAGNDIVLSVKPESSTIKSGGSDLAWVPIELVDSHGTLHTLKDREVTVKLDCSEEVATIAGLGSANPDAVEGYTAKSHPSFMGRVLLMVRSGAKKGKVGVRVSAEGCEVVVASVEVI